MKELTLMLIFFGTMAHASGPGYIFDDPEPTPPECVWFGFIPCHVPQGPNDPFVDGPTRTIADWWQEPPRQREPEPEVCK